MLKMIFMNKKLVIGILAGIVIFSFVTFLHNYSTKGIIHEIDESDLMVSPVIGEEIGVKREFIASHSSFWVLVLAKVMGTSTVKKDVYLRMFEGKPMKQAVKEAVKNMPEEEIGLLFDLDGVLVEMTRFRSAIIAKRVALLQTELLKKDLEHAQCDNPEYENRMTCSKMVYIHKRNFLFTVSDIKELIDIYDDNGRRIARDYEAVPTDKFNKVIETLRALG